MTARPVFSGSKRRAAISHGCLNTPIKVSVTAGCDDCFEYLGALPDITERVQAKETLHRTQAELTHICRVTTLRDLTASIVDDVNQPLTAITSSADGCRRWLDRPHPKISEAMRALNQINGSARGPAQHSLCKKVRAGIHTGMFNAAEAQYANSVIVVFPYPTDDVRMLTKAATEAVVRVYRQDYRYGLALFCRAAFSDLVIDAPEVTELCGISVQQTAARVMSIAKVSSDVARVRVASPPDRTFVHYPGQYVQILLKDGARRSYSMATRGPRDNQLEFHIRHMPGGVFSSYVFEGLMPKAILHLEGPYSCLSAEGIPFTNSLASALRLLHGRVVVKGDLTTYGLTVKKQYDIRYSQLNYDKTD